MPQTRRNSAGATAAVAPPQTPVAPKANIKPPAERPHQRAINSLDVMVRSRCPIIFIECPEERKLMTMLGEFAKRRSKKLIMWDCVTGPGCLEGDPQYKTIQEEPETLMDPLEMLNWIEKDAEIPGANDEGSGGGAIYVMLDLHNWLQGSGSGARGQMDGVERDIIRKLRSIAESLKRQHKTIIILSRDRVMPTDLMEIVQSMQWPLPTYEEIRTELDSLISQLQVKVNGMSNEVDKTLPSFTSDERDEMSRAMCGLSMERIEAVFKQNTVTAYQMSPQEHVENIIRAKKAIIADADCGLTYIDTDMLPDIDEIGGLHVLKEYIRTRTSLHSTAARDYGIPNLKGILLIGVQGCGKSMTAKSVGKLWRLPTLRLDVGAIFTSLVGASENRMRRAISYMEAMAPCVVWLDEIEKSMAGTGSSDRSDAGTAARVFSTMLTWMSDRTAAVYLVATANNPQTLPAEMIRAGRFDERFSIDLPTIPERIEIYSAHIRRFGRDPQMFDLARIAADDASEHFSGAEIEKVIVEAMTNAFSDGGREFTTDDILKVCNTMFPLAETMAEQVQAVRGWAKDRCRPASERLAVNDRLKRRQEAAKKLEETADKGDATGAMAGVDIGPQSPLGDLTPPAPTSPDLGD